MIHRTRVFPIVTCGQIILCLNEVNKSIYKNANAYSNRNESTVLSADTTGRIETVKFFDYQLMAHDSFANDLVFFLFSSVNHVDRRMHMEHFFKYYHEHLYKTLALLECPLDDYTYEKYVHTFWLSNFWLLILGYLRSFLPFQMSYGN